jgi:hypothetical protein
MLYLLLHVLRLCFHFLTRSGYACANGDTWASEYGTLSKGTVLLVTTRKQVRLVLVIVLMFSCFVLCVLVYITYCISSFILYCTIVEFQSILSSGPQGNEWGRVFARHVGQYCWRTFHWIGIHHFNGRRFLFVLGIVGQHLLSLHFLRRILFFRWFDGMPD